MKKSTWLHLRIPFSFFLAPVFFFAVAMADASISIEFWLIFVILHLLLYPASNGYNSYFDKDEESIGGLKNPPAVSKELHVVSLIFDGLALSLGLYISWQFSLMLFIYGLVSKAYSHPSVRLKKMPFLGWLAAGLFQGYFTFLMVVLGVSGGEFSSVLNTKIQFGGILSTMLLFGSYPMTQVYQHSEDKRRGDRTISLLLGVLGTFHFTAAFFGLSVSMFVWYYLTYFTAAEAMIFQLALLPVLVYFFVWYWKTRKDQANADFDHTMKLNLLSSCCLNGYFIWLWLS
ncbi:MAG: UbiA prenyltransferase family protein [Cyclobacteriaceae bacterium]